MRPSAVLLAALLLASSAAAAVTVNPRVVVDGDRVRLGDVFDGAGAAADVTVAAAPAPGGQLLLRAFELERLAAQHGLDWQPAPTLRHVLVSRASRTVSPIEVRRALERALAHRLGGGRIAVDLSTRDLTLYAPPNGTPEIAIESLSLDGSSGRFEAVLSATPGADPSLRLNVLGRVTELVEVPVLARDVTAGEVLTARDLDWLEVPRDRMDRRALGDASEIAGMAARRNLSAGRPLLARDVEVPVVVAKGALVTLTLNAPGMRLAAAGRALEDGASGAVIQVLNVQSKRTVQATVIGPQIVEVAAKSALQRNAMVMR